MLKQSIPECGSLRANMLDEQPAFLFGSGRLGNESRTWPELLHPMSVQVSTNGRLKVRVIALVLKCSCGSSSTVERIFEQEGHVFADCFMCLNALGSSPRTGLQPSAQSRDQEAQQRNDNCEVKFPLVCHVWYLSCVLRRLTPDSTDLYKTGSGQPNIKPLAAGRGHKCLPDNHFCPIPQVSSTVSGWPAGAHNPPDLAGHGRPQPVQGIAPVASDDPRRSCS